MQNKKPAILISSSCPPPPSRGQAPAGIWSISESLDSRFRGSDDKGCTQSGNAFIFILMGIVLFSALAFTISRGFQGETTKNLSAQEATLVASDILSYAQKVARAVDKLRQKGVSENNISFHQGLVAGYDYAQPDTYNIFHPTGGGVSWQVPEDGANDGSAWIYTGGTCIAGIGTGVTGCNTDVVSNEELLAVLPNVTDSVCTEINKRLKITGIPADTGGGASATKFVGTYADGTEIILASGPFTSACFSFGGHNIFYTVLLER